MISIILLLISFLQAAFCGPLVELGSGCITDTKLPIASDCHQVIGAFSQKDPSGYITLDGKATLRIVHGSCEGTLYNTQSTTARVNEATLAVEMTTNIFDLCIIDGKWGRWETDNHSIRLLYADSNDQPLNRDQDVQSPAEHKRDGAVTICIDYPWAASPPIQADCKSALGGLLESATDGYVQVAAHACLKNVAASCSAFACNRQPHVLKIDLEGLYLLFQEHVFYPCVYHGKYGSWEADDASMTLAMYEAAAR